MKIKLAILKKIFKHATAKEIDFLVHSMRFQDKYGSVKGLYANEICKAIKIHRSYLSDLIRSLKRKGIIEADWSNGHTKSWSIRLLGNLFIDESHYGDGYINLNTRFLYDERFLNLKKNEKIIMLHFLSNYRVKRKSMTFTLGKMMEWTGCKLRSVKSYIKNIKNIFINNQFIVTNKKISFHPGSDLFSRVYDETDFYNEHVLETIIRENRADADEATKKSIIGMFKQFAKCKYEIIVEAILTCIKNQNGKLIAPYINKLIQILHKDYQSHSNPKETVVY